MPAQDDRLAPPEHIAFPWFDDAPFDNLNDPSAAAAALFAVCVATHRVQELSAMCEALTKLFTVTPTTGARADTLTPSLGRRRSTDTRTTCFGDSKPSLLDDVAADK